MDKRAERNIDNFAGLLDKAQIKFWLKSIPCNKWAIILLNTAH